MVFKILVFFLLIVEFMFYLEQLRNQDGLVHLNHGVNPMQIATNISNTHMKGNNDLNCDQRANGSITGLISSCRMWILEKKRSEM